MRARSLTVAASAALVLGLAACGAAQDVADQAGDAAKSKASQEASKAVSAVVEDQICAVVGDGAVSAADLSTLQGLVTSAEDAGVPADILDPVKDVVATGESATDSLAELEEKCAAR